MAECSQLSGYLVYKPGGSEFAFFFVCLFGVLELCSSVWNSVVNCLVLNVFEVLMGLSDFNFELIICNSILLEYIKIK